MQCDLMLWGFFGFKKCSNSLRFAILGLIKLNVVFQCCKSLLGNAVDNKTLYFNVQQSVEIIHIRQVLQLSIRQSIEVHKTVLNTT